MCIRIKNDYGSMKYDAKIPLEEQLTDSQTVIIKYEPNDPSMDRFLSEMERLVKNGVSCNVSLDVMHNNHIKGAKAKKQVKRLKKDLDLNEAIKVLVNIHSELDKQLEAISLFCHKR